MGYQYRGTVRDVEEPPPIIKPRAKPLGQFKPDACGTYAGYRRHQQYSVPACDACMEARRSYDREYAERRKGRPKLGPPSFQPEKCGTVAGYAQHQRYGIHRCEPCLEAHREYTREWKMRAK